MHDEIQRLRRLVALAEDALARRGDRPPGDERLIGVVKQVTALPTAAGVFYGMSPARISGAAAEGGAATIAVDTSRTFYADVVGKAPSLGDRLIARRVADRWVARRGGGTTPVGCSQACITVTGCAGTVIAGATVTLTLSGVTALTLVSGGSGYANGTGYALTFTGGGFSSVATGTFDVVGGAVTNLQLTRSGSGYTSNPTVGFSAAGAGTGASATATISTTTVGSAVTGGTVNTATVTNAASNGPYSNTAPAVTFGASPLGSASTATGTALLTGGAMNTPTVTAAGSYSAIPTVSFGGAGTGTTAAGTARMGVNSAAVAAGGTGYTVGDVLTVAGGSSTTTAQLTVSTVSGGAIAAVTVSRAGVYSALPGSPASVTGGTGSGATFTLTDWGVVSIVLGNAGTLYYLPTVAFATVSGSGAAATATAAAIRVNGVRVDFSGDGYSSAPSVTFAAPPSGTTATGTAALATRACIQVFQCAGGTVKYNVSVSPPSAPVGYASNTGTVNVTSSNQTATATIALGLATGYSCLADVCCPQSGPPYPPYTYPATRTLTDGFGSVTLHRIGTTKNYDGCATRTAATARLSPCSPSTSGSNQPVEVYFTLNCGTLQVFYNVCTSGDHPLAGVSNTACGGTYSNQEGLVIPQTSFTCQPMSGTWQLQSYAIVPNIGDIYALGTVFTISD